ncbi:hypothetical protein [Kitasatospora sp. NPDC127116]|uniref:hypothetical protein n=1 Tax=Kitasatospora sp. NPDC127116 TaxID=3345367 RepID=UPI0036325409
MGIKLIVEFMDHTPAGLTPAEWKAMIVVLEDANDGTRLTWSAMTDPRIVHRVGLSPEGWKNLRAVLVRKGALEVAVAGRRGRAAKYRVPCFAPLGHGSDAETDLGHESDAPTGSIGHESDAETEALGHGVDAESAPMGHEAHAASAQWGMGLTPPTPPFTPPSQPPSLPTASETRPEAERTAEGGEGGRTASRRQDNPAAYNALARITARHPQLALGETELAELAPLVDPWLERTTEARMELAITAGLPTAVASPVGFLRRRLVQKLPPLLQTVPDEERCGRANCDPITHMITLPDGDQAYCSVCHPTGRAIARRAQGNAA